MFVDWQKKETAQEENKEKEQTLAKKKGKKCKHCPETIFWIGKTPYNDEDCTDIHECAFEQKREQELEKKLEKEVETKK